MTEIVRLLLAAVFVVAAVAKLADRDGSRRAARAFGAPGWVGIVLPVVELAIALALVPGATARAAAVGAAALLALFALAIGIALARGRTPDCHCFGRLHSAPAGWGTLARNAALAALAAVVVWQPASDPTWIELAAAGIVLVVAAQLILSLVLLRRYGRALRRIEELETRPARRALEVGAEAPVFALPAGDGPPFTLEELLARAKPVLLVFSSSGCGPCRALLPRVVEWRERLTDELTVVLLEDEPVIAEWYGVEATPSAVLVGVDGKIAHALVGGAGAIEKLVGSLTSEREPKPEPATNGRVRVATAAALAGGLAVTAAAQAASRETAALDPELQAIEDALRAGGARVVAAAERSRKAIRAQATVKTGEKVRRAREAAKKALAAERREVIALREKVDSLAEASPGAHNVKMMVHWSLSLLSQSLQKRERAIGAEPRVARPLLKDAQELLLRSAGSMAAAGKVMKDSQ